MILRCLLVLILLAPRIAIAQSPDINQVLSIIAERDRQYNQRFEAQEKATTTALATAKEAVQSALVAAKEAVQKAETASEKRFEGVNEFRKSLEDNTRTFMPRAEADTRFREIERRLTEITASIARRENETRGAEALWGYIVGGIGIIGVIGMALFNWSGRMQRQVT